MRRHKNYLNSLHIFFLFLFLISNLMMRPPLLAQEDELQLDPVNLSQFPEITLRVSHPGGLNLSSIRALEIAENGQAHTPTIVETTPIRVAFLIDVWKKDFPDALLKLISLQMALVNAELSAEWRPEQDRIAAFKPGDADGKTLLPIHDWTGDIAQFNQQIQLLSTPLNRDAAIEKTAINQLLIDVLNAPEFSVNDGSEKFLILVSNGLDLYTKDNRADLATILIAAVEHDIQIYIVNFPARYADVRGTSHLADLANNTDTALRSLDDAGEIRDIGQKIAASHRATTLRYTTGSPAIPFEQKIQVRYPSSGLESNVVPINIAPISVRIDEPAPNVSFEPGDSIEVSGAFLDAEHPLQEINFAGIEYWFNEDSPQLVAELEGASPEFRFTIPRVEENEARLSVRLVDSIPGLFAVQSIPIAVAAPAQPASEPIVTIVPDEPEQPFVPSLWEQFTGLLNRILERSTVINWLAILLALAALLTVLLLGWNIQRFRRRQRPAQGRRTGTYDRSTYDPTTREWNPEQGVQPPKAELVLIQGEGLLPGLITLRDESIIFGSERRQVDVLMIDRYVSQVQFILEERNGNYRIRNQSITNPTLVNGGDIPGDTMLILRSGDVIQFGPVKYRFLSNVMGAYTYRDHDWYVPDVIADDEVDIYTSPQSSQTAPVPPLPPRRQTRTASRTRTSAFTRATPPTTSADPTDQATQANPSRTSSGTRSTGAMPTRTTSTRATSTRTSERSGETSEVPPSGPGGTAAIPPRRGGGTGDVS